MSATEETDKRILPAFILWLFLGGLGAHRFYLRLYVSGCALFLLTLIGIAVLIGWEDPAGLAWLIASGIWVMIDLVRIVTGSMRDGDGYAVTKWT